MEGGKRRPSAAIRAPGGVSNSTVPLWLAVSANRSVRVKEECPEGGSGMVPEPMVVPASFLIVTGTVTDKDETFASATPVATPFVLSKARV